MTVPITHKLSLFADPLMRGDDFPLCLVGDSKIADTATNSYLGFGMAQTWKPPVWSGWLRSGHGNDNNNPNKWLHEPGYSPSAMTTRQPGDTFSGAEVGCFPVQGGDSSGAKADGSILIRDELLGAFTLTVNSGNFAAAAGGVQVGACTATCNLYFGMPVSISGAVSPPNGDYLALTGVVTGAAGIDDFGVINPSGGASSGGATITVPSRWASGDWFDGTAMIGRLIYWRGSGFTTSTDLRGRRSKGATLNTTNINADGAAGVQSADVSFNASAGYPGFVLACVAGITETRFYYGGFCWYKGTAGVRTPGLMVGAVAHSAWTTRHMCNALGSGTDTITVSQANALAWLQVGFVPVSGGVAGPSYWAVDGGQNSVNSGAFDELNSGGAGGYTTGSAAQYKLNIQAIINQINVLHTAMGKPGQAVILLCSGYNAGTIAYNALRSQVLYELAQENENCCFIDVYALMAERNGAATKTFNLVDGTHPTVAGSNAWAQALWTALAENYAMTSGGEVSSAGRGGGFSIGI